jgi:hypothetical protein
LENNKNPSAIGIGRLENNCLNIKKFYTTVFDLTDVDLHPKLAYTVYSTSFSLH